MGAQAFDSILRRGVLDGISNLAPLPAATITTSRQPPISPSSISSRSSTSSRPVSASSSSSVSPSIVSSTLPTTSTTTTTSTTEQFSGSSSSPLITTIVVETPYLVPPATNAGSDTSFLQNKVASGFVFAIVGIFGLVGIIFIATFVIRRNANKRLMREAVSFDPVTVGHDDLEKAKQSSSLGHESHDTKSPTTAMYNPYSPPPSHYPSGSPPASYTPHMAAQLYAPPPPARYSSPPLPTQQHPHLQRHPSYMSSSMSSAEDAGYSRPMPDETRGSVGPAIGGQVPEDIRRQYSTT